MVSRRFPAGPWAIAVLIGVNLGLRSVWSPPLLLVLLLALAWSLRGTWGGVLVALTLGLLVGVAARDPSHRFESTRPVTVVARLTEDWRRDGDGIKTVAKGEWLHQGIRSQRWRQRLLVVLPSGSVPPPSPRVRVRGLLRRTPGPANGERVRPGLWILRAKSVHFVTAARSSWIRSTWWSLATRLRGRIEARLAATCGLPMGPGERIVRALVLGQGSDLPVAWRRGLRSAGLSHLVALSGLHVGLLAGGGFLLSAGASMRLRLCIVTVLVLFYLLVAGPRPSLLRACLMLLAVGAAWLLARPPVVINILAWVAMAMVLSSPTVVSDVGFQLTVAATAGILVLGPRFEQRWRHLPRYLRTPLSVSVAAHLGALGWALPVFHLLTPLSPIWNLAAVPWTALTLLTAIIWTVLLMILPPAAALSEPFLDALAQPYAWIALMSPALLRPIPVHLAGVASIALTGLLTLTLLARRWVWKGLALGLATLLVVHGTQDARVPELIVIDVGQGEAILLRDQQAVALVDGGGWRRADIAQRILVPTLSRYGVRRLDAVFLTHPDQDHCGGLADLASYLPIDRLLTPPGWDHSACVQELLGLPRLPVQALWRGEEARVGEWSLEVLHPAAGDRRGRNDRSLVLLARVPGHRALLTGDLGTAGERELLAAFPRRLQSIEILKVGHHGSSSSTSPEWLHRLRPRLALISCGTGNHYGHPSPEVVLRLRSEGAAVLRTDSHGLIRILLAPGSAPQILLPGRPRR